MTIIVNDKTEQEKIEIITKTVTNIIRENGLGVTVSGARKWILYGLQVYSYPQKSIQIDFSCMFPMVSNMRFDESVDIRKNFTITIDWNFHALQYQHKILDELEIYRRKLDGVQDKIMALLSQPVT